MRDWIVNFVVKRWGALAVKVAVARLAAHLADGHLGVTIDVNTLTAVIGSGLLAVWHLLEKKFPQLSPAN